MRSKARSGSLARSGLLDYSREVVTAPPPAGEARRYPCPVALGTQVHNVVSAQGGEELHLAATHPSHQIGVEIHPFPHVGISSRRRPARLEELGARVFKPVEDNIRGALASQVS